MPTARPVPTPQLITHAVGRRTVARGLAWTVPVIAIGAVMPYASASTQCSKTTTSYSSPTQTTTVTIPSGASAVSVVLTAASGGDGDHGRAGAGVDRSRIAPAASRVSGGDVQQVTLTLTGTLSSDLTVTFQNATGGQGAYSSTDGSPRAGANGANGIGVTVSGAVGGQSFTAALGAPGGTGGTGAANGLPNGGNGGNSGNGSSTISSNTAGVITSTPVASSVKTGTNNGSDATVTISYCA